MISDKRLAANRANGALSRGPKTPEGKARSSQNARKHGLFSSIVTLRNEDREAFDEAYRAYFDRFQPVDEFERSMVEEMAAAHWAIRRNLAIETGMLDSEMDARPNAPSELGRLAAAFGDLAEKSKLGTLHRQTFRLQNTRSRAMRDYALLRHTVPPPANAAPIEAFVEEVSAAEEQAPGTSSPAAKTQNEPKTIIVSNKTPENEPTADNLADSPAPAYNIKIVPLPPLRF